MIEPPSKVLDAVFNLPAPPGELDAATIERLILHGVSTVKLAGKQYRVTVEQVMVDKP